METVTHGPGTNNTNIFIELKIEFKRKKNQVSSFDKLMSLYEYVHIYEEEPHRQFVLESTTSVHPQPQITVRLIESSLKV